MNLEIKEKDSLEKIDIEVIGSLINKSKEIDKSTPGKAFELSLKAYSLSKKINYEKGIIQSLIQIGSCLWLLGEFEKAIPYLIEGEEISKSVGNKECEVHFSTILGNIYFDLDNYDKALEYYMTGLKIAKKIEYSKMKSALLNNIGEIYKELEGYDTALKYYLESLMIREIIGDEYGRGTPLLNIGEVYYWLRDFENAKRYLEESLEIFKQYDDRMGEAYTIHLLAKIYYELDKKDLSLSYYYKSLAILRETGSVYNEIEIILDLQDIFVEKKDFNNAIKYLRRALILAEERKINSIIAKVCSKLANIYEMMKDYKMALYYYKKFHDKEKENNNIELKQKLKNVAIQLKMEQAQREKEIYRQKNKELKVKNNELKQKTAELEELYNNIKIISKIGQSITSTLDLEKVLSTVYENINLLMDAAFFGVGLYNEETRSIEYKLFVDEYKRIPQVVTSIDNLNSLAAWCVRNKKEIFINDIDREFQNYIINEEKFNIGKRGESIIYCPLIVENSVIGMVTAQSYQKFAFTKKDLDTMKALASYIAIAINNAQKSQKLSEEINIRKVAQKELEEVNKKLSNLSKIDDLTQIPNRRKFFEVLEKEWLRAKREKYSLALLIIDIDFFKEYNDNYGHLPGDWCLKEVANALQSVPMRASDFVARYGGDEFIAILPNTDNEGAILVAENMRRRIEELKIKHQFSKVNKCVTVTIGVTTIIPNSSLSIEEFINSADKALYIAKQQGRNNIGVV